MDLWLIENYFCYCSVIIFHVIKHRYRLFIHRCGVTTRIVCIARARCVSVRYSRCQCAWCLCYALSVRMNLFQFASCQKSLKYGICHSAVHQRSWIALLLYAEWSNWTSVVVDKWEEKCKWKKMREMSLTPQTQIHQRDIVCVQWINSTESPALNTEHISITIEANTKYTLEAHWTESDMNRGVLSANHIVFYWHCIGSETSLRWMHCVLCKFSASHVWRICLVVAIFSFYDHEFGKMSVKSEKRRTLCPFEWIGYSGASVSCPQKNEWRNEKKKKTFTKT